MSRPAPADLDYAPTFAKVFINPSNVDLTTQFTEAQWPACQLQITVVTAGTLTVTMQSDPTVNVVLRYTVGVWWLRGSFSKLIASSQADTEVAVFWQGGPC